MQTEHRALTLPAPAAGAGVRAAVRSSHNRVAVWGKRLLWLNLAAWGIGLYAGFTVGLGILTFAALIMATVWIRRPALGLLGVAVLCTLDTPSRVFIFGNISFLPWNTFNYLLLAAAGLSWYFQMQVRDVHSRLLLFFLIFALSYLLITPVPLSGFQHLLYAMGFFGLLYYLAFAPDASWYWGGLNAAVASAAGSLVYYLKEGSNPLDTLLINHNAWSYFPLTGIFALHLGYSFCRTRAQQYGFIGLAIVNLVWVFMSTSRGGFLVACLAVAFLFLRAQGISRKTVFLLGGSLLFVGVLLQFPGYQDVMLARLDKVVDSSYTASQRTSSRTTIIRAGWNLFRAYPLGVGTGAFYHYMGLEGDELGMKGRALQAHSGWIKTLAENGIVGGILLLAFVTSFLVMAILKRGKVSIYVGGLAAFALGAAWMVTEFQPKGLWFLAAGITILYHRERYNRWVAIARRRSRFVR